MGNIRSKEKVIPLAPATPCAGVFFWVKVRHSAHSQAMCFTRRMLSGSVMLTKEVILFLTVLFVPAVLYFAGRGGFYSSVHYTGNGSAHGTVEE